MLGGGSAVGSCLRETEMLQRRSDELLHGRVGAREEGAEPSGTQWNPLELSGTQWNTVEISGTQWDSEEPWATAARRRRESPVTGS